MRRASTITLFLVALGAAGVGPASADDRRVALTIGSSACPAQAPLPKAVGDARAIADMLRAAGFDRVHSLSDPRRDEVSAALNAFGNEAGDADIAVVFYAGCGAEIGGTTYLVPADARVSSVEDLAAMVPLDAVRQAIKPAKRLGLVLYDASRSDPFSSRIKRRVAARPISSGLDKIEDDATSTLIVYASKAGSEAYDGESAHSPFTAALLAHLPTPGLDVSLALRRVREAVLKTTNRVQEPFVYGALGGDTIALVPAARR